SGFTKTEKRMALKSVAIHRGARLRCPGSRPESWPGFPSSGALAPPLLLFCREIGPNRTRLPYPVLKAPPVGARISLRKAKAHVPRSGALAKKLFRFVVIGRFLFSLKKKNGRQPFSLILAVLGSVGRNGNPSSVAMRAVEIPRFPGTSQSATAVFG